jgi:PAS domain S-box-containing protein
VQDTTGKKAGQLQLNEAAMQQSLFASIINSSDDAIVSKTLDGTITSWNKGAEKVFGYTSEEMVGKSIFTIIPQSLLGEEAAIIAKIKNGEYVKHYETERIKKGGEYIDVSLTVSPILDPNGKVIGASKIARDITERKKTERELQKTNKSLEDYKFALDESTIIAFTDNKGIITYVNDNFCKISKYSREELIGKTHQVVNSKYHSKDFFKDLWLTISSGKVWKGEIKNKTKDNAYYWVYTTIVPFLDKNNKPIQYLAIRFDITEKKMAEEKAIETLVEKNIILESIRDAFFAVDKNWNVTYWNNQAEKMLKVPKDKIVGYNLWDTFSGITNSETYDKYHQAVETGQAIQFEIYSEHWSSWYEISAYPSSEKGLSVYFKDISERKQNEIYSKELNEMLSRHVKELAISNAELEQFAYVASHDLQEPLRMITAFLTQLEKKYTDVIDDKGKKYIAFAVDGAKRMRQIILDLLEFSRVGKTNDSKENLNLNELIKEIQILFRKQIEETKAVIEVGPLPVINAYKTPLRQVFQNLIGNALKYSKKGVPVELKIAAEDLGSHWKFSIADNGIGIEKEYFDKIFIIFQRLHNKDEYSGTGMGLAIAKKIIENQGGEIWVESEEGKGSCFYFTILKQGK